MKNVFSEKLKELIHLSGIKQQSIAQATGYDLSYISKWIGGKMLPSEKTIETTVEIIARSISLEAGKDTSWIAERYGEPQGKTASELIKIELLEAYNISKGTQKNLATYHVSLSSKQFYKSIYDLIDTSDSASLIIDLFAMDRESRQILIGLEDGYYKKEQYDSKKKVSLVISTTNCDEIIYDAVSLIHLITVFSRFDFNLINGTIASGKAVAVSTNKIVSGFIIENSSKVFSVSISNAINSGVEIQNEFTRMAQKIGSVYLKKDMVSFANCKDYLKSMLSTNIRWVQGHITELIMPADLYEKLLASIKGVNKDEAERIYMFSKNIIEQDSTNILMYETALSDLVATGEVDFYNNKIVLSPEEIEAYICFLIKIFETCNVQLISAPLFPEFRHAYSPCLYISDSICYIRIENAYGSDNILEITDMDVRMLFENFYSDVTDKRRDVIIKDKSVILQRLEHYKRMAHIAVG